MYNKNFFTDQKEGSLVSAKKIVPLIVDLLHPQSVVDLGCGTGLWLSVFRKNKVKEVLGIDGKWVSEILTIPSKDFKAMDLSHEIDLNRKFDLAISLEVAEHLPKRSADSLVSSLTNLSDNVVFSAAIPHQGGTHHINEQWQDYWGNKFLKKGYVAIDYIRPKIWNDAEVRWWYSQNMILFMKEDILKKKKKLMNEYKRTQGLPLSVVHPANFHYSGTNWDKAKNYVYRKLIRV